MARNAGIWIDGRKAVIVYLEDGVLEKSLVLSNIDKHPGRVIGVRTGPNIGARDFPAKDHEERYYEKQILLYLDQVASALHSCGKVFVMGPGETRKELIDRLTCRKYGGEVVGCEVVGRMTDPQIVARVRRFFEAKP